MSSEFLPKSTAGDDTDNAGDDNGSDKANKDSMWHRMKWTDEMVRLLIAIVAHIGDDGPPERSVSAPPTKGKKWKAISMLMIGKGCFVSPQQCEDKFNDLNRKYKRLNEILDRGCSCDVVENPSLLDSMNQLSLKAKNDVIKILSSKQLFYREMCAYHNGQRIPHTEDLELPVINVSKEVGNDDNEERNEENRMMGCEKFRIEINRVINDKMMSAGEKRVWLWKRERQLGEQRLEIEAERLELEKQRFQWLRFRSKKECEMERMRLVNVKMTLENQQMEMELSRKAPEMYRKRSREAMESAGFQMDKEHGGDQMEEDGMSAALY